MCLEQIGVAFNAWLLNNSVAFFTVTKRSWRLWFKLRDFLNTLSFDLLVIFKMPRLNQLQYDSSSLSFRQTDQLRNLRQSFLLSCQSYNLFAPFVELPLLLLLGLRWHPVSLV